jgi:hypothetical protein
VQDAVAPRDPSPAGGDRPATPAVAAQASARPALPSREAADIRALRRCFPEIPTWSDPQVLDLLDRATGYQEEDDFDGVLACAEEAARQAPRSVEAHHNRALAFMRLGRFDEARDALALALALAPDDAECLELAAELYINRLAPSAERTAIGLEYARRGPGPDQRRAQPRPVGPAVAAGRAGAGRPGALGRGPGAAGACPAAESRRRVGPLRAGGRPVRALPLPRRTQGL